MPRIPPGSSSGRKPDEKPIRSPDERNLLQFSPFIGLEEGALSPRGRFCRVMTKKSGSNAPPTFKAVHSNDLSQAGSMDSHDEESASESRLNLDSIPRKKSSRTNANLEIQGRQNKQDSNEDRSTGVPQENPEIDRLITSGRIAAQIEQKRGKVAEAADEAGFAKMSTRMTKMFPKTPSRERFEGKTPTVEENENSNASSKGFSVRRLTPGNTVRPKAAPNVPDEEDRDNDLRHNRSSKSRLPPRSLSLRLSRSLDADFEPGEAVGGTSLNLADSNEDVELRRRLLRRPARSRIVDTPPTGDLAVNALVSRRKSVRDLIHRKSGRQRKSPTLPIKTAEKSLAPRRGSLSVRASPLCDAETVIEMQARKGTASSLQGYSPRRGEKKGQVEDAGQGRSPEKVSPKSSAVGANCSRSLYGIDAVDTTISDEDLTRRSVEIERFLNDMADF